MWIFMSWDREWGNEQESSPHIYMITGKKFRKFPMATPNFFRRKMIFTGKNVNDVKKLILKVGKATKNKCKEKQQ